MQEEKKQTRTAQVTILDPYFSMPQLKRTRRIWIYVPESYASGEKQYPVLYMQDGQNLFDASTAFSGEWGVDKSLDALQAETIVVGIDHGGERRFNEYSVHDHHKHGKAEGKKYLEFIVKTLKPYIDQEYRTLPGRESTSIAGSSMGGLISLHGGLIYPQVFGTVGIFSPSFTSDPLSPKTALQWMKKKRLPQDYFFYAGTAESDTMVNDMLGIYDIVKKYNKGRTEVVIRAGGQHNEARWAIEFPGFYKWMLASQENQEPAAAKEEAS